jgi:serine/threonine-protein kinase
MTNQPADSLNEALEGRYRVERELGEGGMATVYLADDLKHKRKVALKVLKPELAAVVGADRFLAEIETTANLQHPHILPLHDSGEAKGFLYYVMPYIEGESLRDRLDRERQLPVEEAVKIATDLAEALDYAHRQGVIHRDIKPANVLMHEGRPLIADFGIALAVGAASGARLTETGLSVGTPYYMSPEQATGDQNVGPQSDIYALGCVLFEMLTGDPPYPGSSAQAVLGKIIQGDPVSATTIRRSVPSNVDGAIRMALEKLPADRFTNAQSFAKALGDGAFRHGEALGVQAGGGVAGSWRTAAFGLGALALLASAGVGYLATRPAPEAPVVRYRLTFGGDQSPAASGQAAFGVSVALSDDGERLAYVVQTGPEFGLWLRERDALEAAPVRGAEGGFQPFFSPDGTRVGFMVDATRQIKVVSLTGEPPLTVVDGGIFRLGGSWGPDDYLYFVEQPRAGVSRIPVAGGAIEPISTPDTTRNESRHGWPSVLPNGRGVLVTLMRGVNIYNPEDDVAVIDLETGEVKTLLRGTLGRYASTGHLLVVTHEGDLVAAPFDADRLEITGPTVPLLSGLQAAQRGPDLAVSASGRLLYSPVAQSEGYEVAWVDRAGRPIPIEQSWTVLRTVASGVTVSPDERSMALSVQGEEGPEIWIKEVGGPFTRFGFAPGSSSARPTWSPDGRSVLFFNNQLGDWDLYVRRADGSTGSELFMDAEVGLVHANWSRDGEWIVAATNPNPTRDIVAWRPGVDSVPTSLIATEFEESTPMLSPDGRFLAHVSAESGQTEVHLRPFPNVTDWRVVVSSDGGREPVWSPSGDELFYKNQAQQLIAVQLRSAEDRLEVVDRIPLFDLLPGDSYIGDHSTYTMSRDGERFLMILAAGASQEAPGEFVVVENFPTELLAKVGR